MGDLEYGNCSVCNMQGHVNRKYYKYDVKCECCNGENDDHFEIVYHCNDCEPKPPEKISVYLKPKN